MKALHNVSVFNARGKPSDKPICSGLNGTLDQAKKESSFDTTVTLSGGNTQNLVVGESYYVIGLTEDRGPVRSEVVQCSRAGDSPVLQGSIPFPKKPADYPSPSDAGSSMFMSFSNYSSIAFERFSEYSYLQLGFGNLTSSPGPSLQAGAGQESMGASQILGWLDEGPADISVSWSTLDGNFNIGVWIHFNFQMFRIGPEPVWYVTSDGGANWASNGDDPSDPYTWNLPGAPFKVTARPTEAHASCSVEVTITDNK
jgi:hypothetical protein